MHRDANIAADVVRWLARLGSLASFAFVASVAATAPSGPPTLKEAVGLALFPVGVLAGFAVAWWREVAGGAVALASLALFYAWMTLTDGRPPRGPYFALLASPGALFLASGLMARWHRPAPAVSPGP
jgi:hypothetical protein